MTDLTDTLAAMRERVDAATEGPWMYRPEVLGVRNTTVMAGGEQVGYFSVGQAMPTDATFIAHARTDLPRLLAAVEAVVALHVRKHAVLSWHTGPRYLDPCPDCDGKAGVHDCGCWADQDIEYVCAECHRLGSGSRFVYDYTWPCPTIRALTDALGGE